MLRPENMEESKRARVKLRYEIACDIISISLIALSPCPLRASGPFPQLALGGERPPSRPRHAPKRPLGTVTAKLKTAEKRALLSAERITDHGSRITWAWGRGQNARGGASFRSRGAEGRLPRGAWPYHRGNHGAWTHRGPRPPARSGARRRGGGVEPSRHLSPQHGCARGTGEVLATG